jgi:hypothetical protein
VILALCDGPPVPTRSIMNEVDLTTSHHSAKAGETSLRMEVIGLRAGYGIIDNPGVRSVQRSHSPCREQFGRHRSEQWVSEPNGVLSLTSRVRADHRDTRPLGDRGGVTHLRVAPVGHRREDRDRWLLRERGRAEDLPHRRGECAHASADRPSQSVRQLGTFSASAVFAVQSPFDG